MPLTEQSSPFIQTPSAPGVINLGLGQPSPRLRVDGVGVELRDEINALLAREHGKG